MPIINNGQSNKINLRPEINPDSEQRVNVNVQGDNNKIEFIGRLEGRGMVNITIIASDCNVVVGENVKVTRGLEIVIVPAGGGTPSSHCSVLIGKECFFNGVTSFVLAESNNEVVIGDNCLMGNGITFNTSDSHAIYDLDSEERVNPSASIILGRNIWVGANAHFLKKSAVADGSVVAAHSVVTRQFTSSNVVMAGNPAKIVKENIRWEQKV